MTNIAIIPAAGGSTRMGEGEHKIFRKIEGVPILVRTLRAFEKAESIHSIMIAIRPEDHERIDTMITEFGCNKISQLVAGGITRQQSVAHALFHLKETPEVIVVHDAARPFVTPVMIDRAVAEAKKLGAVVFGIRPTDTVKRVHANSHVHETLVRDELQLIQTPEAFQFPILLQAHLHGGDGTTGALDDAELVEKIGKSVTVLPGDPKNFKITTTDDLALAEKFVQEVKREV